MERFNQDELPILASIRLFEGISSGGISLVIPCTPERVKGVMLKAERAGLGEYFIQDGMWFFFFLNDDTRLCAREYCKERGG